MRRLYKLESALGYISEFTIWPKIFGPDIWIPSPINTPQLFLKDMINALVGTVLLKSMEGDHKLPLNGLVVTHIPTLSAD